MIFFARNNRLGFVTILFVPLIEVRNLTKVFPLGESAFGGGSKGEVRAVDDVSLDVHSGETLGPFGVPDRGPGVAGPLDPRMPVEDLIAEPMVIHRSPTSRKGGEKWGTPANFSSGKNGIRTEVEDLLKAVGLDSSVMRRYPHEFSGGQRQRIVIARALALRPKFIVCDEPVSALDVSVGAQIVNLLAQLQRDFGLTYLFISHSMPVVRYLSTRIAVMYRGKIVEINSTDQITANPQHPYTKALLEATPEIAV